MGSRAKSGGMLSVPPIHVALVERLGHDIPISTTYRLLARTDGARSNRIPNTRRVIPPCRMSLKKLPEMVDAACIKKEEHFPVRLMFENEARLGRMRDPRACWVPFPHRPVVNLALIREFRYEYAAVSPWDGCLDYMTAEKMNAENMSAFLAPVSTAHESAFIVMILDGASSHKAKDLVVPWIPRRLRSYRAKQ